MSHLQTQIRKVGRTEVPEPLWPVVFAAVLLFGFLLGVNFAYLSPADPRWYANAWTGVIAIALGFVICLLAIGVVGNRWMRRTMQFALLICFLLHLILWVAARETSIFGRMMIRTADSRQVQREQRVVPEYHEFQMNRRPDQRQDFERPVETTAVEPEQEVSLQRERQSQEANPSERQTLPVPEPRETVRANVTEQRREAESMPRRSEQSGQLSRQTRPTQPTLQTAAARVSEAKATAAAPQPSPTQLTRAAQSSQANRPLPEATRQPESRPSPSPPALARSENAAQQLPRTSAQAVLPRADRTPTKTPNALAEAVERPREIRSQTPEATPQATALAGRQESSSPTQRRVAKPQSLETADDLQRRQQERANLAEQLPELAQSPAPTANRRPRTTVRPDPTATVAQATDAATPTQAQLEPRVVDNARPSADSPDATSVAKASSNPSNASTESTTRSAPRARRQETQATPQVVASPSSNQPARTARQEFTPRSVAPASAATPVLTQGARTPTNRMGPAETALARQVGAATSADRVSSQQPPTPATDAGQATAERSLNRNASQSQPSVAPSTAQETTIAKSATTRTVDAAPAQVDTQPLAQVQPSRPSPSQQPAQTALSQGQQGTAGGPRGMNLQGRDPAAESVANLAASSSSPTRTTQATETGPALAPSQPAQLARRQTSGQRATPNVTAETQGAGSTLGSAQSSQVAQSANASLTEASSNADRAETTATQGAGSVELGATRRVPENQVGRAAAGGQPEIALATPTATAQRQREGTEAAHNANPEVAEVVQSRESAGAPQPTLQSANANVAARSSPATTETAASGAVSTVDEAELTERGAQALLAERATRPTTGVPTLVDDREQPRSPDRSANSQLAVNPTAQIEDLPTGAMSANEQDDVELSPSEAVGRSASPTRRAASPATAATVAQAGDASGEAAPTSLTQATQLPGTRTEAADGSVGALRIGGGNQLARQRQAGRNLAADLPAPRVSTPGEPQPSASSNVVAAEGTPVGRTASGLRGTISDRPIGTIAGEASPGTNSPDSGVLAGQRRVVAGAMGQPAVTSGAEGSPGRRVARVDLAGTTAAPIALPDSATAAAGGPATQRDLANNLTRESAPMGRTSQGAQLADIAAIEGPGGLGPELATEIGVADRRASKDSEQLSVRSSRFLNRTPAGLPDVNTKAVIAAQPFRRRVARNRGDNVDGGGDQPSAEVEDAIERGLAFLAGLQQEDGSWSLDSIPEDESPVMASDTAATGMALLAFQGAGYNHREEKYAEVVRKGIEYLIRQQSPEGDLHISMDEQSNRIVAFYGHGIGAIALCEAYGMTQDPTLREPAQRSLDWIMRTQNPERGGWRYTLYPEGTARSSDTSVSGWMLMALKSGELAGLSVDPICFRRIDRWLELAKSTREPFKFRYNPYAPNSQIQGRQPTKTMTAVGLLMKLYTGWDRDERLFRQGADYLRENLPSHGTQREPQRDTYYWYYASQVMFHMGGEHWQAWKERLEGLLINSQVAEGSLAGSWDPSGTIPDRWGSNGGRLYVTALNLLSLEVYYRHLPLYQNTASAANAERPQ